MRHPAIRGGQRSKEPRYKLKAKQQTTAPHSERRAQNALSYGADEAIELQLKAPFGMAENPRIYAAQRSSRAHFDDLQAH